MKVLDDPSLNSEVAITIARAFDEDPCFKYLIPSPNKRQNLVFESMMDELRHELNIVITTSDEESSSDKKSAIRSCAIFLKEFMNLNKSKEELMKDHKEKGYYYLQVLGADSTFRGKGYGTNSISPILELSDEENRFCYLENTNVKNIPFYEKHGFKVMKKTRFCGNVDIFHMIRQPQEKKKQ